MCQQNTATALQRVSVREKNRDRERGDSGKYIYVIIDVNQPQLRDRER